MNDPKGGYVCVFSTSLVGTIIGALWLIIRIRSYNWKSDKKSISLKSAFSIQHPIECITTTFKKREGPNRKYILILMLMTVLTLTPAIGEAVVTYPYVRTRYQWEYEEWSYYGSVTSTSRIIGKF